MIPLKRLIIVLFIFTLTSCGDSLKCGPRRYHGPGIAELNKTIAEQERRVKEGGETPAKLALSYQKLGEKYLENKMWNPAIETFMKALELGRENPLVHYSLGVAFGNKAKSDNSAPDLEKAEFHYRKALAINPGHKSAAYGLAILTFYLKGEKEEGIRILEELVEGHKSYYHERMALGRFYFDAGKTTRALAHYQTLCGDLEAARDNPLISEYRKACKDNADSLMLHSAPRGGEK
jgi:tetratricopeptide (TPR) repeat protein